MYKRKTEEDLDCGLYVAMKVFGSKWKPCIIQAIAMGAKRPCEIHKQITSTSPRVIDMQLSELLDFGVVQKESQGGYPLYVEYSLTSFGESVLPLLVQITGWGEMHKEFVKKRNGLIVGGERNGIAQALPVMAGDTNVDDLDLLSVCQGI